MQFLDQAVGGNRALHDVQQRFAGMLVEHRRDLDRVAVDGGVDIPMPEASCAPGLPMLPGLTLPVLWSAMKRATLHLVASFTPQDH